LDRWPERTPHRAIRYADPDTNTLQPATLQVDRRVSFTTKQNTTSVVYYAQAVTYHDNYALFALLSALPFSFALSISALRTAAALAALLRFAGSRSHRSLARVSARGGRSLARAVRLYVVREFRLLLGRDARWHHGGSAMRGPASRQAGRANWLPSRLHNSYCADSTHCMRDEL